jgi:hypothetical protein
MRDNWPSRPSSTPVWRLAIYAGVLALPVIAAVLMFFL